MWYVHSEVSVGVHGDRRTKKKKKKDYWNSKITNHGGLSYAVLKHKLKQWTKIDF